MNKYKIQFSKDARKDLKDIYIYIKYNLQEPITAKKLIDKIRKEIYKLENNPTIYAIIRDEIIKKRGIRRIKVNNYIVFYKVEEKNKIVEIVRIMHERSNWRNIV